MDGSAYNAGGYTAGLRLRLWAYPVLHAWQVVLSVGDVATDFAPSLLPALSLIYLFGNQGMLRWMMDGGSIYGPWGIIGAQIFYCFPAATIILSVALSTADGRLYEAAEALRASRFRIFLTVTLPGAMYGLVSAGVVVFTLVVTDFGIPKVIGGSSTFWPPMSISRSSAGRI